MAANNKAEELVNDLALIVIQAEMKKITITEAVHLAAKKGIEKTWEIMNEQVTERMVV